MNQLSGEPYTAYIGIDWASSKHDICLQLAGGEERVFERIKHTPEAIEEWAQALYQRLGGPIAVALELSEGPIVSALQKYDFLVLFPIDPKRLAKYREAFVPSGNGESYDFAFIDADKTGYDGYYESCLALLRPGGVIAIDNALWGGSVANSAKNSEDTQAIRALNEKVSRDPRVEAYLAPVGDGVHLAWKR